jgi:hypothetical protein
MAKKSRAEANNNPVDSGPAESISGYFRRLFRENPKLLRSRSNDQLLRRWLEDHPGATEVPGTVKANLANVKSLLRRKGRKQRDRGQPGEQPQVAPAAVTRLKGKELEHLEERIDDCMTLARGLGPVELERVILSLRRARNEVVWKLGR